MIKSYRKNTNYIAILEASPIDQKLLDFETEVLNIEDSIYLNGHNYNYAPIVRFATNKNLFEYTVKNYNPCMFHFTCHGTEEALVFVSPKGVTRHYSNEKLIKCLNEKSKPGNVNLMYLNTCDSMKTASKLRNNKHDNARIYKTIGFMGANASAYATEFSQIFYKYLMTKTVDYSEINVCKTYQLAKKDFLQKDPYGYKIDYIKRLRVCKR